MPPGSDASRKGLTLRRAEHKLLHAPMHSMRLSIRIFASFVAEEKRRT